jgi:hypothetical protein
MYQNLRPEDRAVARLEDRLILSSARTRLDAGSALEDGLGRTASEFSLDSLDWEYIIATAERHRVLPLITEHLHTYQNDYGQIPEPARQRMQQYTQRCIQRNLALTLELRGLLKLLDSQGIPAIPYKGLALGFSAYKAVALRPVRDLDLIVRKVDIPRITALMLANGYYRTTDTGEPLEQSAEESSSNRFRYVVTFRRGEDHPQIEIHWRFSADTQVLPFEEAGFWQNLQPLKFSGISTVSMTPENTLLLLLAHGSKHLWSELLWTCDVLEYVRQHPTLDWELLERRAATLNAIRFVHLGVLVAHRLLGLQSPLLERARTDVTALHICEAICADYFTPKETHLAELRQYLTEVRLREGWRQRLEFVAYLLNTTSPSHRDMAFLRLPRPLYFLYGILRPMRAAWQYGTDFVRALFR